MEDFASGHKKLKTALADMYKLMSKALMHQTNDYLRLLLTKLRDNSKYSDSEHKTVFSIESSPVYVEKLEFI